MDTIVFSPCPPLKIFYLNQSMMPVETDLEGFSWNGGLYFPGTWID
jgi:hypothetical protein